MGMAQLSRKYQIHPNAIRGWRKQAHKYKDRAFAGRGKAYTELGRHYKTAPVNHKRILSRIIAPTSAKNSA
jgi:transposase-like protein